MSLRKQILVSNARRSAKERKEDDPVLAARAKLKQKDGDDATKGTTVIPILAGDGSAPLETSIPAGKCSNRRTRPPLGRSLLGDDGSLQSRAMRLIDTGKVFKDVVGLYNAEIERLRNKLELKRNALVMLLAESKAAGGPTRGQAIRIRQLMAHSLALQERMADTSAHYDKTLERFAAFVARIEMQRECNAEPALDT